MHLRIVLYTCILLFTLGLAAQAASVPLLLNHQGRLLDTNDEPVSGMRTLTFHVYEASSGGAPLWTEVHPSVMISEGLFTVLLGSTVPMQSDLFSPPSSLPLERWLEVAVDGVSLLPRIRLASVPYASSSSRVDGDVVTSPGELRLHGMSGSTTGTIRMKASDGGNEDSTQLYLYARKNGQVTSADFDYKATSTRSSMTMGTDEDGDAHHETQLTAIATFTDGTTMDITSDPDDDGTPNGQAMMKSKGSSGGLLLGGMSGSTTGTIRMIATPDSTGQVLDVDDDGDGFSEMQARLRLGTSNGGLEISSDRFGSGPRQSVSMDGSFSHAQTQCASDFDRDGIPDVVVASRTDSSGGRNVLEQDSDDDGVEDMSIESSVTDDSATFRLNGLPPGTPYIGNFTVSTSGSTTSGVLSGMSGSTTGTIRMMATPDSTVHEDSTLDASGYGGTLKGFTSNVRSTTSLGVDRASSGSSSDVTCDETSARGILHGMSGSTTGTIRMAADGSGGGGGGGSVGELSSLILEADLDGDAVADHSISSEIDDDGPSLSISNGEGTRGQITAKSGMSGSTTATIRMATDGSGGGGGGGSVGELSSLILEADLDGDGDVENSISSIIDDTDGSSLSISNGEGTRGQISAKSGMSGSTTGTIRMTAMPDSSDVTTETDSDGDGTAETSIQCKTHANGGALIMHGSTTGTIRMDVSNSGPGSTLTIGDVTTSHFIDVEGGAYCDGTNWVNASDVASKENFERVDGAKLLDQIADLEISRWNYKGQDGVEHIGPTAQDFQAAFGVGADDKSISTIDPSGIALAAIKELQKQNAELRAQLEALNRKVESLSATR